ncbi:MAG: VOC family protein [Oscillospiraceae bacterium]|nr:VOC family protein [Oscillospiraceae bacterium]
MSGIMGTHVLTQVALVVHDIEASKARLAQLLGVPEPPVFGSGEYAVTQTEVRGAPAPGAACKMAFFSVGDSVQIELIQPNETPSVWRDFLNERGEGLHHIAFNVKGMDSVILSCEGFGMTLLQKGNYGDGGGRYAYFGGGGLPFILELLENF